MGMGKRWFSFIRKLGNSQRPIECPFGGVMIVRKKI